MSRPSLAGRLTLTALVLVMLTGSAPARAESLRFRIQPEASEITFRATSRLMNAEGHFGRFSGDLLVGNFGDGQIHAYAQLANGVWVPRGELLQPDETPLVIDGLWALSFGNGATNNGPTDTLFFTAGPDDENHGLFGTIRAAG